MKYRQFTADKPTDRLDLFITQSADSITRSQVRRLIEEGLVSVNGMIAKASQSVRVGDSICLTIVPPTTTDLVPEDIPINIVFQDDHMLVVEKPPGLTVHPAPGHPSHTLVNALLTICDDLAGIGGEMRPGIVHRLDKNTSGLIIVAKTNQAHHKLGQQLHDREVDKTYLALATGRLNETEGSIDTPIGRDRRNRKRMAVVSSGRNAITTYKVIRYVQNNTYVEVSLKTGRTHQIRVHFQSIGHPIFGDATYGKKSQLLNRHFLHAHRLSFCHPATGEQMNFTSPLPEDLTEVINRLNHTYKDRSVSIQDD